MPELERGNNPTEPASKHKAREEGTKLRYDAMKHLTTLSTGSILLVIAFLEKLFTNPAWKWLVAIAILSFVLSIIAAFIAMIQFATAVVKSLNLEDEKYILATYLFSMAAFVVGIFSLVIFAWRNLF